jgi:K+-sensing histidine kinase KdpD
LTSEPDPVLLIVTADGAAAASALVAVAAVAMAVSLLGFRAARRSQRAARTATDAARRITEADGMRAALLATLGHDLRSPLAAAKAALTGLRSTDVLPSTTLARSRSRCACRPGCPMSWWTQSSWSGSS